MIRPIILFLIALPLAFPGSAAYAQPKPKELSLEAMQGLDKAWDEYFGCIRTAVERYALQMAEPAASIAEGAIGLCQTQRAAYFRAALVFGMGADGADRNLQTMDERLRPWAMGKVLQIRAERGKQ